MASKILCEFFKKRHRINIWSNNSVPKHISEAMLGETNR